MIYEGGTSILHASQIHRSEADAALSFAPLRRIFSLLIQPSRSILYLGPCGTKPNSCAGRKPG